MNPGKVFARIRLGFILLLLVGLALLTYALFRGPVYDNHGNTNQSHLMRGQVG